MQITRAALLVSAVLLAACGEPAAQETIESATVIPEDVVADPPEPVIETVTAEEVEVTVAADETPVLSAPPPGAGAGLVSLALLTGDIDPASNAAFKRIPEKYLGGSRVWGHAEAVDALVAMADAAAADGVQLKAVSAFRSFRDQKRIWEDKWQGRTRVQGDRLNETITDPETRARKILEFSSMPATSRHHWGTDFDLNDLNNSYFASGKGKAEYEWLLANAGRFGFCQVYSAKGAERPAGYEEEKWHWSYLPVARAYLAQYPETVGYAHITGFAGSEAAQGIDVIANYVEGINPACK